MNILHYLSLAGWFVWPLVILSIILIAVIVERVIYFAVLKKKYSSLGKADSDGRKNEPARIIDKIRKISEPEQRRSTLSLFIDEEYQKNTDSFWILSFIANTAPLFGLLGTIAGIMRLFQQIELTGYNTDPSLLSGGIWQAIITTLAGLIIAIPAIGALHYLDKLNQQQLLLLKKHILEAYYDEE